MIDNDKLMDIRKTVLSKHMQFPPTGKSASGTGFGNKIKNSVLIWDIVFERFMNHENQNVKEKSKYVYGLEIDI